MKKTILALGAFSIMLAACGDGALSVTDYNQKVIGIYNPVDARIGSLMPAFSGDPANKSKDLGIIKSCTKSIDSAKTEIMKLKPPKSALVLHQSVLNIVTYEKDTLMPLLSRVVDASANPDMLSKLQDESRSAEERVTTLTSIMQAEQQKLAASVGASVH